MAGAFVLGALEPARRGGRPRAPRLPATTRTPRSPSSAACCRPWPRACRMVEPPAGLKARIMAAAAADLERTPRAARCRPGRRDRADAARRSPSRPQSSGPRAARGHRPVTWILRIAAVLAIVALGRLEPAPPEPAQRVPGVRAERRRGPRRRRAAGLAHGDPHPRRRDRLRARRGQRRRRRSPSRCRTSRRRRGAPSTRPGPSAVTACRSPLGDFTVGQRRERHRFKAVDVAAREWHRPRADP